MFQNLSARAFENGPLMLWNIGGPFLNAQTVRRQNVLSAKASILEENQTRGETTLTDCSGMPILSDGDRFEPMHL